MIFELREYTAAKGAQEKLLDRFERHTFDLFERHRIRLLGFWTERDDPQRVIYVATFDDEQHRKDAWANFTADPEWQQVKAESESNGPLVEEMHSRVLTRPGMVTHPAIETHD